ncbi:MAG: peptidase [Aureispira sp.]|nr:peptidase [Aureispira sp.]
MHLSKRKARLNRILAVIFSAIIGLTFIAIVWAVQYRDKEPDETFYILVAIDLLVCYSTYSLLTKKFRDRERLRKTPFPEKWKVILKKYVQYYNNLSKEDKTLFETEVQIFLHETRLTGVQTEVDDTTMVLAAASGIIPVFGFEDWEYENLGEILIYPNAFNKQFDLEGHSRHVTGMVGTGIMNGIMILSQPALLAGFKNPMDRHNVGIHEFAHLLDASDGSYDGIPRLFLENQYIQPWLEVMHQESERIEDGKSKMNPYALTNRVEFFAVATEYFFERPDAMKERKPELYDLMTKIFKQDKSNHLGNAFKSLFNYTGKKFNPNGRCPCKSGKKYKNCCLKNAREY